MKKLSDFFYLFIINVLNHDVFNKCVFGKYGTCSP